MTALGVLRWNVLTRFRDYVANIPDGEVRWSGAGRLTPDFAEFELESASLDPVRRHSRFTFCGTLRFSGYVGMLAVTLSDPWLEIGADGAFVSVDPSEPGLPEPRVTIAAVSAGLGSTRVDDHGVLIDSVPALLTAEGAALLGGVYSVGTECAPLTVIASPPPPDDAVRPSDR